MRSVSTRRRLLAIAAWLDARAQAIRAYCRRHTPPRRKAAA
jgi:hypothetical protein